MKILLVSKAPLGAATGSPIRGRNLALCLAGQGARVVTVSPGDVTLQHERITHARCDTTEHLTRFIRENGSFFDILICLTIWEAAEILHAARQAKLPCVVDCHGLGTVQQLDPGMGPLSVKALHTHIAWDMAAMRADGLLAANSVVLEWCTRAYVPVCDAVGLTNVARFASVVPAKRPEKPIRVLYAGGSSHWQGFEGFLDAVPLVLAKSGDFTFHALTETTPGSGLDERLARMHAAGQIIREPYQDFDEYPSFLANFDIGVIPRKLQPASYQSFPQKLVDYMAGGLCVVATDIYPYPEVFSSGEKGVLCPPTPQGIAGAIFALRSEKVRKLFGENARQYAWERFDFTSRGPVIMEFLQMLTENKSCKRSF